MPDPIPAASIEPRPDGPYQVKGAPHLHDSSGVRMAVEGSDVFLCRCGGSAKKPYCDGTHKRIGFSGANLRHEKLGTTKDYAGPDIEIHDNRSICAHIGFCTEHSPKVFDSKRDPWIDPAGDVAEKTAATIQMCPSGALSYTMNNILHRDPVREPAVHVMKNGPYLVVGGPALTSNLQPLSPEHFALCRCGASKNKPFCDGSHYDIGFRHEVR